MSPFTFLIFIIGINIFLRSIGDKKKIEEARKKKMEELKKKQNLKQSKEPEKTIKRKIDRDPAIFKKEREKKFFGEGKSYKDDHKGYQDRYESRYEEMDNKYDTLDDSYKKIESYGKSESLYDKNAIDTRERQYKETDLEGYSKKDKKKEINVLKTSTFKRDVLSGIIFSEILGKPKSMQKKDL